MLALTMAPTWRDDLHVSHAVPWPMAFGGEVSLESGGQVTDALRPLLWLLGIVIALDVLVCAVIVLVSYRVIQAGRFSVENDWQLKEWLREQQPEMVKNVRDISPSEIQGR